MTLYTCNQNDPNPALVLSEPIEQPVRWLVSKLSQTFLCCSIAGHQGGSAQPRTPSFARAPICIGLFLQAQDKIRLTGLGILQVRARPARMGRNPGTGASIKIAASKRIAFRPAKELKEAV